MTSRAMYWKILAKSTVTDTGGFPCAGMEDPERYLVSIKCTKVTSCLSIPSSSALGRLANWQQGSMPSYMNGRKQSGASIDQRKDTEDGNEDE